MCLTTRIVVHCILCLVLYIIIHELHYCIRFIAGLIYSFNLSSFCLLVVEAMFLIKVVNAFLGSGPDRGRSPVEWEDFPSVCLFVNPSVRPSVPLPCLPP